MSDFSVLLGNIIKTNNISVYGLSKNLGCGRTWLQKVLSGERHMDMDSFVSLRKELMECLDSSSLDQLYDTFVSDYYGQDEYRIITFIRDRFLETKRLEEYIRSMDQKTFSPAQFLSEYGYGEMDEEKNQLTIRIYEVLSEELKNSQAEQRNYQAYIHLPSKWKHLKNFLLAFLYINEISYTPCLKYVVDSGQDNPIDLNRMENFLTAVEFASYGYNTYTDETAGGWQNDPIIIFPYYLITPDRILLIADDGKTCIDNTQADVVRKTSDRFEKMVADKKLFMAGMNAEVYHSVIMDGEMEKTGEYFEISNYLHMEKFYPEDLLQSLFPADYPDREFMIRTLSMFYEKIRSSRILMCFSISAVRQFLESEKTTGREASMLRLLCDYFLSGDGDIRMIKSEQRLTGDRICIFCWKGKIICTSGKLLHKEGDHEGFQQEDYDNAVAVIRSPAISRHLYHYHQYMMNSQMCLDKENSLKVLENLIRAYEGGERILGMKK